MNDLVWKMTDSEQLEEAVEHFFKMAYKTKMQGNMKESQIYTTKALRLQGSLTKTTPIEAPPPPPDGMPKRGDYLHLKVHRRDDMTGTQFDKSKTYKFKN